MKPKVLITHELPGDSIQKLKEIADVEILEDSNVNKAVLMEKIVDKEAIISFLGDEIDQDIIKQGNKLRIIANYAVGFNNIDVESAKKCGIIVTNTPDVLTDSTADLTWGLIMAIARRIPEGDAFVKNNLFKGWEPQLLIGQAVSGKTLGIIGMGRIGQAVARRANGFQMKVLYTKRTRLTEAEERSLNAEYCSLEELLQQSDFVSLHTPLSDATKHLIRKEQLDFMKPTAYLINTSRGALIHEKDLVEKLKAKEILWSCFRCI